jgi:hypothetical protein
MFILQYYINDFSYVDLMQWKLNYMNKQYAVLLNEYVQARRIPNNAMAGINFQRDYQKLVETKNNIIREFDDLLNNLP